MDEKEQKAKRQGQVVKAIDELDEAIVLLINRIEGLGKLVQCVCRPEEPVGPSEESKTVTEMPEVPMVQSLNIMAARVLDATNYLAGILERLEL